MFVFVILPVLVWILLFGRFRALETEWQAAVLRASVFFGIILTGITELLSLLHWLTFAGVLISWIAVGVGLLALMIRFPASRPDKQQAIPRSKSAVWLVIASAIVLAVVGITSFIAPINNWDSMTYHMSRVVHWEQNHTVAHYPTAVLRQLYQHPFAEFVLLHAQVLSGGDRFANLVQFVALVGCAIGVTVITRQLGGSGYAQAGAFLFTVTLPMGIMQATSTQNDLVTSFWLVCLTWMAVQPAYVVYQWKNSIFVGGALGLLVLTKGTGYVYGFPVMFWITFSLIKEYRLQAAQRLAVIGGLALLLCCGHLLRNVALFEFPTGPRGSHYSNQVISVQAFSSNVIRNLALHVQVPPELDEVIGLSEWVDHSVRAVHDHVLHISVDDPRTTLPGAKFAASTAYWGDSVAPNPAHLLIGLIAVLVFVLRRGWRTNRQTAACLLLIGAECAVFCIVLRWQVWHSRLHLPIFMLLSAFVGVVIFARANAWLRYGVALLLLITAVGPLTQNNFRPLIGDDSILKQDRLMATFIAYPALKTPYLEVTDTISAQGCRDIGLVTAEGPWEYPLWPLLRQKSEGDIRIEHIRFDVALSYPRGDFVPCAVVGIRQPWDGNPVQFAGVEFVKHKTWDDVRVELFLPSEVQE
ncbi:MAG: glycosyltransferase family 39 protein [Anaerolineae bacterium]|nr:glycosyltransferase family 39 protein [Anaerolineae bacterium]